MVTMTAVLVTNGEHLPTWTEVPASVCASVESMSSPQGICGAPLLPGEPYRLAFPLGEASPKIAAPSALAAACAPLTPEKHVLALVLARKSVEYRLQESEDDFLLS
ncbi:hypothetical protein UY3_10889 [Chelonia mydas]|uniref:Uncharacterized protein n=1 Tax=Chelonia mydas TaxID=8469 RepID=M7B275_CHEMY|nr:hypothetical protein UY3_10889 [Chelonia mydas]